MNVSGLVVTLCGDPDRAERAAAAVAAAGPFTLGPRLGSRLTVALEAADDRAGAEWFDWLGRVDGVVKADVAFVHFDPGEEVDHA